MSDYINNEYDRRTFPINDNNFDIPAKIRIAFT